MRNAKITQPCACRDCPDVTGSNDTSKPELCSDCQEAGCEPLPMQPFPGMLSMFDCQRADAPDNATESL